jgi:hypothetical protein
VVPVVPGAGRPDPPSHLDASEAQIWRAVVGSLPDHWIDAAGEQILCRLVCQAAIAQRCEQQLRELRAQRSSEDEKPDRTSFGAEAEERRQEDRERWRRLMEQQRA